MDDISPPPPDWYREPLDMAPTVHIRPLDIPHPVDPHVYRAMQETVRFLEWQSRNRAHLTAVPITLSDIEQSAVRILGTLIDDLVFTLTTASERLVHEVTRTPTHKPLPNGMTRIAALEQSTGLQKAAGLVASYLAFRRKTG